MCAAGANVSNMVSAAGARLLFLLVSGEFLREIFTKTFAAGLVCIFLNPAALLRVILPPLVS